MKDGNSDVISRTLSGAVAGLLSRIVSAPLDVLKIRFQLQDSGRPKYTSVSQAVRNIIKEEGFRGLWKGNIPATYLWVSYSAFQFMCYGEIKRHGDSYMLHCGVGDKNAPAHAAVNFVSGAASGCVATALSYPFDIMRTQFAIQGDRVIHTSMVKYVHQSYAQNQLSGFFRGLPAALAGIVPFMGLHFTLYEVFKLKGQECYSLLLSSTSANDLPSIAFVSGLAGGAAGGISKLLVYPLDTMKKHMQAQVLTDTFQCGQRQKVTLPVSKVAPCDDHSSLRACFRTILRNEGLFAFYKGIAPTLAKSVLSSAVTFYVYEGCFIILKSWSSA